MTADKQPDNTDFTLNHLDETTTAADHPVSVESDSQPDQELLDSGLNTFNADEQIGAQDLTPAEPEAAISMPDSALPEQIAPPEQPAPPVASEQPDFSSDRFPPIAAVDATKQTIDKPVTASDPLHHSHSKTTDNNHAEPPTNPLCRPTLLAGLALILAVVAIAIALTQKPADTPSTEAFDNGSITDIENRLELLEQDTGRLQEHEQRFTDLQERLTALNQRIGTLSQQLAQNSQRAAPRPVSRPAQPSVKSLPPAISAPLQSGWIINIAASQSLQAAKNEQSRLQQRGINTMLTPVTKNGKTWYRLHTPAFDSREHADAYKRTLAGKYGIKDAWTQKQ